MVHPEGNLREVGIVPGLIDMTVAERQLNGDL